MAVIASGVTALMVLGGAYASAASAASISSADTALSAETSSAASGVKMPVGNLPGWKQIYSIDFGKSVALGSFPGKTYGSKLSVYNGFLDTFSNGKYNKGIISVQGGALDVHLHTISGRPQVAAVVPMTNGQYDGQTYGRFSVRMKADSLSGYGPAFLLWSDRNKWSDGEIDFPESGFNHSIVGYNHCLGSRIAQNCLVATTNSKYTTWHTYTINWTPKRLSFILDGKVIGSTTKDIPSRPMHWVMQFDALKRHSTGQAGNVLIDWATIYRYAP